MFILFSFPKLEFWSVMTLIALYAFFCKGDRAPNLSMINNCAPQGTKASVMSLTFVFQNLGGIVIIQILGEYIGTDLKSYDTSMTLALVSCAVISSVLFFLSGLNYKTI